MISCRICGSNHIKFYSNIIIMNKHNAMLHLCLDCESAFIISPHWLDEAYLIPIPEADNTIDRSNYIYKIIIDLIDYYKLKEPFLDYGCGNGELIDLFSECDYTGFDKYNIKYSLTNFKEKYGFISCIEVIEHLERPVEVFDFLFKKSDNVLISTVPITFPLPYLDEWNYYAFKYGQHITFYSIRALGLIAKHYGFSVRHFGSQNHLHFFERINYD